MRDYRIIDTPGVHLPGGAQQPSGYTGELVGMLQQLMRGGAGSGARTAGELDSVLGGRPDVVTAADATKGITESYGSLYQMLLDQNPELGRQIKQTAPTTTLGGASSELESYWRRIVGDSIAAEKGAGAAGPDTFWNDIPRLVTGKAMEYQGQQQGYLAQLLGLSGNLEGSALNAATGLWNTSMTTTAGAAGDYDRMLAAAFGIGEQDYNTKSGSVLQAILNSSLSSDPAANRGGGGGGGSSANGGWASAPAPFDFAHKSYTPSGGMGFTPSSSGNWLSGNDAWGFRSTGDIAARVGRNDLWSM